MKCVIYHKDNTDRYEGNNNPDYECYLKNPILHIEYPLMKGAIFLNHVGKIEILNTDFVSNDPGPIIDNL